MFVPLRALHVCVWCGGYMSVSLRAWVHACEVCDSVYVMVYVMVYDRVG